MVPDPECANRVAAAKAGSEEAWRFLIETHQGSLIRLAWTMTGDRELAAELAQETFVEAFVRIRQLRENGAFGAWLRTILVRAARRHFGRQKALPPRETEDRRTPEAEAIGGELRAAVDQALASLSPPCREAMAVAMAGGLSSAGAAALLGCSPEAYRVRLHKARRELRRLLADFLQE